MSGGTGKAASPRDRGTTRLGATAAERRLWKAAQAGEVADVTELPEASRRVSPAFIRRLLTQEAARIAPAGVRLRGAWLDGPLELERVGAAQPFAPALALLDCTGPGAGGVVLDLNEAALVALDLSGSRVAGFRGAGLRLAGALRLDGVRFGGFNFAEGDYPSIILSGAAVDGALWLSGAPRGLLPEPAGNLLMDVARIGGRVTIGNIALNRLILRNADLGEMLVISPAATLGHPVAEPFMALMADGLKVRGNVYINGPDTAVEGETRLPGADIGGLLLIGTGAVLRRPDGAALNADGAAIKGDVLIQGAGTRIEGVARLPSTNIGGQLFIGAGAVLRGPNGSALNASGSVVKGDVLIQGAGTRIEGEALLIGAEIGGILSVAGGATMRRPDGNVLSADRANIKGSLFIQGTDTRIEGETRLLGAAIGGQFAVRGGATLQGFQGQALTADSATIKGGVFIQDVGTRIEGATRLLGAEVGGQLSLSGGAVLERPAGDALSADGAVISGDVFIHGAGTRIEGETRLLRAAIGGQLSLGNGAVLRRPEGHALSTDGAVIKGGVFIQGEGTRIEGETRLPGAEIDGPLSLGGGVVLERPKGVALSADGAVIKGDVFIQGMARIEGETRLRGAEIGGVLDVSGGAVLQRPEGYALNADRATIKGAVFVQGAGTLIAGEARLPGAKIDGTLAVADGAVLRRPDGEALNGGGAVIRGGVFIQGAGTLIEGETRLLGAEIGGVLAVSGGAVLRRPEGDALSAATAVIKGGLYLRDSDPATPPQRACTLHGRLSLVEARITGIADLRGAAVNLMPDAEYGPPSPPGIAIDATGLRLDGDLRLGDDSTAPRRFGAAATCGAIALDRAQITGALVLNGAQLEPGNFGDEAETAVSLEGARIGARIECHHLPTATRGIIDLRGAHTAFLDDRGGRGWGEPCRVEEDRLCGIRLRLDGFTYDRLPDFDGTDAAADATAGREAVVRHRLDFLYRQFTGPDPTQQDYAPQPFEQAAKVLRAHGHPQEAEAIARTKREFRTRCQVDDWYVRWLQHFLAWGFGHFYSPLRAIRTLGLAVAAGFALLLIGDAAGVLVKKVSEVPLPQVQLQALAPRAGSAAAPKTPREGCWVPPPTHRWAWTPAVIGEAAVMAFDILLPLVDLKQDQRCEPNWDRAVLGRGFGVLMAVYSALGLIIFPLFIATVSGLAKRD